MEAENPQLIRNLDKNERPREKLIQHGPDALSDAELMAIIFSTGIKGKSVIQLCQEIINENGGLSGVAKLPIKELCRHKGVGEAKAVTLVAALKLGARTVSDALKKKNDAITTPEMAYDIMRHRMERLQHEEFWILLLNRGGKVIRDVRISQGGTAATSVDVKIILKAAIESLASSILLFHNHPSGTLRPSVEDDKLTKKIAEAAALVDMRVTDHIIISDTGFYSYTANGRL